MTISTPQVSRYTGGSNRELHALWESGVATLHPAYSLPLAKFSTLLAYPTAVTFVARKDDAIVGFALTYTIRSGASTNPAAAHLKGTLSALAVSPSARGVGVGTALHGAAMAYLTTTVRESLARSTPPAAESVIQLGSVFPRIFPGLPALDAFKGSKEWFAARGWTFDADVAIDLYGRIPAPVDQSAFLAKPHGHGLTFRPARPGDEEGIMLLQKEFDSFTGWPDMFPKFFAANKHADVHLAVARSGEIVGATLAALAPSPMHDNMAFATQLGNNCGAIGCVGVSSRTRGEGAGVGMVASAMLDLEARGADGVFIDWVSMKGFYERFGVERWEGAYWGSTRKVTATA